MIKINIQFLNEGRMKKFGLRSGSHAIEISWGSLKRLSKNRLDLYITQLDSIYHKEAVKDRVRWRGVTWTKTTPHKITGYEIPSVIFG